MGVGAKLTPEQIRAAHARWYADPGMSLVALGREVGLDPRSLTRWFDRLGLPRRPYEPLRATPEARLRRADDAATATETYGRDYMAECLAMAAGELGYTPGATEFRAFAREWGLPSQARYIQVFGTWAEACRAAGLEPNPTWPGVTYERTGYEACLEALRTCAREIGEVPSLNEYEAWQRGKRSPELRRSEAGPYPSAPLVRQRAPDGRWATAVRDAFGLVRRDA